MKHGLDNERVLLRGVSIMLTKTNVSDRVMIIKRYILLGIAMQLVSWRWEDHKRELQAIYSVVARREQCVS